MNSSRAWNSVDKAWHLSASPCI